MSVTVQIQSVLFNNQKTALVRTLENLQNAMRVDEETNQCVREDVYKRQADNSGRNNVEEPYHVSAAHHGL